MKSIARGVVIVLVCPALSAQGVPEKQIAATIERVEITNQSWRLVGDLQRPESAGRHPAVLMLNQAAGDRRPYAALARELASRGIVSLRLDLRGHGESTNLGRFVPGESPRDPLIWDAESDVIAGYRYLAAHEAVDPDRIGALGASYSGEEAAEAGRLAGYAALYVLLSPGSLSEASITSMKQAGAPWLFVASRDDPYLGKITEAVRTAAPSTEFLILPGSAHGTDLLRDHETLSAGVADWIARHLGS